MLALPESSVLTREGVDIVLFDSRVECYNLYVFWTKDLNRDSLSITKDKLHHLMNGVQIEMIEETHEFTLIDPLTPSDELASDWPVLKISERTHTILVKKLDDVVKQMWEVGKPLVLESLKYFAYHKAMCWTGEWCKVVLVKLLLKIFFSAVTNPTMILAMTGYVIYCTRDYFLQPDVISASIIIFNNMIDLQSRTVKLIGCRSQSSQDQCLREKPRSYSRSSALVTEVE